MEAQGYATIYNVRDIALVVQGGTFKVRPEEQGLWRGGFNILLEADPILVGLADRRAMGAAVRKTLLASPLLDPEQPQYNPTEKDFNLILATKLGLSPTKSPYAGMKSCSVDRWINDITLVPFRREHGGYFRAFTGVWVKGHEKIVVSAEIDDEGLGVAVQECLNRCIG